MIHIFCSSLYENPNRRHCISLNPRIVQDLDYCCLLRRSSSSPNNSLAEVFSLLTIEEFILDQNLAAALYLFNNSCFPPFYRAVKEKYDLFNVLSQELKIRIEYDVDATQ